MLAQINWGDLIGQTAPNLASGRTIGDLIGGQGRFSGFTVLLSAFAGMALLVYFIYGGLQLLTSGGDPKKIQSGKSIITNALLGFVIIIIAFLIVQVVGLFLGVQGITSVFG
jgi:hypothetical protein